MRGEYYPNIAELSEDEVAKQAPFGAKWRLLAQVEVRCYILISNISGSVKVAPLQILQFPVILPHKFQDALNCDENVLRDCRIQNNRADWS